MAYKRILPLNTLIISNVEIEKQVVHYRLAYKYSNRSDSKNTPGVIVPMHLLDLADRFKT